MAATSRRTEETALAPTPTPAAPSTVRTHTHAVALALTLTLASCVASGHVIEKAPEPAGQSAEQAADAAGSCLLTLLIQVDPRGDGALQTLHRRLSRSERECEIATARLTTRATTRMYRGTRQLGVGEGGQGVRSCGEEHRQVLRAAASKAADHHRAFPSSLITFAVRLPPLPLTHTHHRLVVLHWTRRGRSRCCRGAGRARSLRR
jgi:hypothetical protein